MRNLFFALVILLPGAARAGISEADRDFDKGLYQEALSKYEGVIKSGRGDRRLKALYRACESEVLLFRYGAAFERLRRAGRPLAPMKPGTAGLPPRQAGLPGDPLWRSRFLILKAELAREFLQQYGYAAPTAVVEGDDDPSRWTRERLHAEAEKAYWELWAHRKVLLGRPVSAESYFIDESKSDREAYPTLFDFFVHRWTGYLLAEAVHPAEMPRPRADAFLGQSYRRSAAAGLAPAALAGALMEDAASSGGSGRDAARELWRIRRLGLPFESGHLFTPFKDAASARGAAAAVLRKWMRRFKTSEGRARAGFEAASHDNALGRYAPAVDLCGEVAKLWPTALGAKKCERLAAGIKTPTMSVSARTTPLSGKGALTVATRNVERIFVRLYRTEPDDIRALQRRGDHWSWSGVLNWIGPQIVKGFLEGRDPVREWSVPAAAGEPYTPRSTTIDIPDPEPGLFLAAVSGDRLFAPGESLLHAALLNVSDLILVGTAGIEGRDRDFIFRPEAPDAEKTAPGFNFYLFDGSSGRPVDGAGIDLRHYDNQRWRGAALKTDALGRARRAVTVRLRPGAYHNFQADPLAGKDGRWAYWSGSSALSFSVPPHLRVFIETDRPIYRPGQTVRYKAVVVETVAGGFRVYKEGTSVEVWARDANGVELKKTKKKLDAMGAISGEFAVPAGRMLGNYSIRAQVSDGVSTYAGDHHFAVEEYKRPEFEVSLDEAEGAWRFGKEVRVRGSAAYYFGGPVPDAAISYRVYRESWLPWFAWWLSPGSFAGGREEVLRAETVADQDGRFEFRFTPQPRDPFAADPLPARFTVEAEARDAGGRTLKTQRTYTAGSKAYLFKVTPSAGFARAGKAFGVDARLVNLSEAPVGGSGEWELRRIEGDPAGAVVADDWGGYFPPSPPLESIYRGVPDGLKIKAGSLLFDKAKESRIDLPALEPGAYRLSLRSEDPWGGEVKASIIVLAADPEGGRLPSNIPALAVPERKEYAVGETALILAGSADIDELTHVEIWGGSFLLERRAVAGGGIRAISVPLTERHKGGVTVRWFGVKDFKPRAGSASFTVPWKEKELSVSLKHKPVLKPAEKASWSLAARDSRGRSVSGQASVRMYDRSLEYYAKGGEGGFDRLYAPRPEPLGARGSTHHLRTTSIRIEKGWIKEVLDAFRRSIQEPLPPGLRLNRTRLRNGFGGIGGAALGAVFPMSAPVRRGRMLSAKSKSAFEAKEEDAMGPAASRQEAEGLPERSEAPEPKARTDFSETAFWKPRLSVSRGKASWDFTAPERLTSWRVLGSVLTGDLKFGRFSETAETKKELMVRVEMPRFLREGDRGTLKAVVHNESGAPLSGTLTLSASVDGAPASERLKLKDLERAFTVDPHGVQALSWPVSAGSGLVDFKIRAVARAGVLVDAEERDLPILPSRQRLIASRVIDLDGTVKKNIALGALAEPDPSRRSELLQLQIDPQLALTVLNSLPFLVEYPHECVEQTLNRYVPIAIVDRIYGKHPAIRAAVAKIPKRNTITPAWDRSDPKRMIRLMETPWLRIAEGRKGAWPIVDMFDPAVVERQRTDALGKLQAAQLPDGGFPWFPGGRANPYITLYVLAGLSEAKHYGVEVPADMVRGALRFVMNEIPRHLKPEEHEVASILYAAYVVTSFPEELSRTEYPELKRARELARVWIDYADKQAGAMTRLGKAYAAFAYRRLGEKAKGDLYLDRTMDGAREDEVAGVYWTPEKNSWLWYNDTLETHAFILRALQTIRPADPRIPGMVRWLLFNRKGTEWKSTKASAAAIFALLDFMKKRGSLDKGDSYAVDWGPVSETVAVGPADWLERPLRWSWAGTREEAARAPPLIDKKGPGFAFASLTYVYTTEQLARESEDGMLNVSRKFYRRVKKGKDYHLVPLESGASVKVGDEIEVRLEIRTRSQFEFVHLKDPRGAGFEAETLRSGWKWDQLGRYEEPRDSLTNFFMDWLPHGEYTLSSRIRPTTPGRYRIAAAVIQSMYSPEFAAHSSGFELSVTE